MNNKIKQQTAKKFEIGFSDFCDDNVIEFERLDDSGSEFQRGNFLIDINGESPDFWCRKDNQEMFVEVKTLVNITNDKRERQMNKAIESGRKEGKSYFPICAPFNLIPELMGPLESSLKKASSQFKNIKEEFDFPRILLLSNVLGINSNALAIFLGYPFYISKQKMSLGTYFEVGKNFQYIDKLERGLFDKTGSNVSAVVFWNKEAQCFNGIANPLAKIKFSESSFSLFFGVKT